MKTLSIEELGLQVAHVAITRTSLDVGQDATDQDYARLEQVLDAVGGSVQWWWGDYLNHLASARGSEYAEAKAASSYAPGVLKNAAWVCRHVARSRRHDRLSFAHHYEVAALSPTDQEIWLDRAEDEDWNVKDLRAAIRQSKAAVTNGPEQAPTDQRAARASASWEEFSMWYEIESPTFTPDQRQEWDEALRPKVQEFLSRLSFDEVTALYEAAT